VTDSETSSVPTRAAVWFATALLPRGPDRERYRRELDGEMRSLSGAARVRLAAGMMASAYALRRAVVAPSREPGGPIVAPTHKPLLCRLHLHHVWRNETTDDGKRYRRCALCGLDDDGLVSRRFPDHNEMIISYFGNRF
jgi:hypothetical protein